MMMLLRVAYATLSLVACCFAASQDVLTILQQQSGISTFVGLLEQFTDLVDTLNQGTFSVLIPNDQALAAFGDENPDLANNTDAVRALLEYHIVHGTHPSASFGLQPLFVPTLLTHPNYTNVTGGQVVELTALNNQPAVVSGVKAESHVVEADIFYLGGLIHIIDSVLTIPLSFPATATKVGLTDLVALMSIGGFLKPSSPAVEIVNSLSDLTIFAPNSTRFSAGFTGWDGLSQTDLYSILEYSISQGPVIYSSEFKNNTKIPTLEKISASMTEVDSQFYVDAALIKARDYLTSNGVLQILDSPLNPNTTGQAPLTTAPPSTKPASKGLSTAAGAGIGIGIGALILGGALIVALYIRTRRRRRLVEMAGGNPRDPPPRYELETKALDATSANVRDAPRTQVFEIQAPPKPPSPYEIDGNERSRISVTIQGTPPRHLGFQARY
ncbi:hypothetical protein AYO21_04730 [Fonsecaea monophora]|uniref:FAS1 domain-containing protein n=1 Tax=Fonsecaea monophora TaxID=254056 RepID=A0A177FA20_9EURO|nr:hypothetical protein AYO21_04730 [Fonsecaea monophora]KAH0839137.1 beta-Ig-H3/fasciclin [Fonsecaea pedrosoi]OAG41117.1 hypothetical protein AYO21_04730 [Fonsecaea monophora]